MSLELFLSLLVFAFVSSITPGPNNLMLMASGVNFGFRRTVPHMGGSVIGFFSLLLCVGFGMGALLISYPRLHFGLKIASGCWLLYLSWKIASARALFEGSTGTGAPLTWMQATLFQWINPKGWISAMTGMAIYTDPARRAPTVLLVMLAFALVAIPSMSSWTLFGVAMRKFLSDPVRLKWFNIAMGVALAATLWPLLR